MPAFPLSRRLALRLGLAARSLPGVSVRQLVGLLLAMLRLPLTEHKLQGLSLQMLRAAPGGLLRHQPRPALQQALAYLQDRATVDIIDPRIPPAQPCAPGELPASLRVAVCASEGLHLDAGFSDCLRFLIYQVSAQQVRLVDVRGTAGGHGHADPQGWRVRQLGDCQLLLTLAIGTPQVARLLHRRVHVLRYARPRSVPAALAELQQVLAERPPPWLAKLIGAPSPCLQRYLAQAA